MFHRLKSIHHVSSVIIIDHHWSSFIIIYQHWSSYIITYHHWSSFLIIYHHCSSLIIIDHHWSQIGHHSSSFVIICHHLSSLISIDNHLSSLVIMYTFIYPSTCTGQNCALVTISGFGVFSTWTTQAAAQLCSDHVDSSSASIGWGSSHHPTSGGREGWEGGWKLGTWEHHGTKKNIVK